MCCSGQIRLQQGEAKESRIRRQPRENTRRHIHALTLNLQERLHISSTFSFTFYPPSTLTDTMTVSSPTEVAPPPPRAPITSTGTGIANLPNQRHKIVAKNGANFTLMVCGE